MRDAAGISQFQMLPLCFMFSFLSTNLRMATYFIRHLDRQDWRYFLLSPGWHCHHFDWGLLGSTALQELAAGVLLAVSLVSVVIGVTVT